MACAPLLARGSGTPTSGPGECGTSPSGRPWRRSRSSRRSAASRGRSAARSAAIRTYSGGECRDKVPGGRAHQVAPRPSAHGTVAVERHHRHAHPERLSGHGAAVERERIEPDVDLGVGRRGTPRAGTCRGARSARRRSRAREQPQIALAGARRCRARRLEQQTRARHRCEDIRPERDHLGCELRQAVEAAERDSAPLVRAGRSRHGRRALRAGVAPAHRRRPNDPLRERPVLIGGQKPRSAMTRRWRPGRSYRRSRASLPATGAGRRAKVSGRWPAVWPLRSTRTSMLSARITRPPAASSRPRDLAPGVALARSGLSGRPPVAVGVAVDLDVGRSCAPGSAPGSSRPGGDGSRPRRSRCAVAAPGRGRSGERAPCCERRREPLIPGAGAVGKRLRSAVESYWRASSKFEAAAALSGRGRARPGTVPCARRAARASAVRSQVVVGLGMIGLQRQRLLVAGDGRVEMAAVLVRYAQPVDASAKSGRAASACSKQAMASAGRPMAWSAAPRSYNVSGVAGAMATVRSSSPIASLERPAA